MSVKKADGLVMTGTMMHKINRLGHQAMRHVRLFLRSVRRKIGRLWRRLFWRRIPLAMVTGTKGKTTTVYMLAHLLTVAGHRVGFNSTHGVVIAGEYLNHGDSAGFYGARTVVRDKSLTAAVLEVARGGLLSTGPYMDRCNVGALLNVGREQIEMDGVDTVEQMARVKQRVIHAARDVVVLNADDEQCVRLIGEYPVKRVVLFTLEENSAVAKKHLAAGGVVLQRSLFSGEDCVVRCEGGSVELLVSIAGLPSCCNGVFPQNIANAMAAAALAEGLDVSREDIRKGLETFESAPGNLNLIDGYSQTVLIDNASQPPACEALAESVKKLSVRGKRVCMLHSVGNRPDWHYEEMTAALAPCFDKFICYEVEEYRRGRAPGEITSLLRNGLIQGGVLQDRIDMAETCDEATRKLSQTAGEEDLLVILVSSLHEYLPVFKKRFAPHRK